MYLLYFIYEGKFNDYLTIFPTKILWYKLLVKVTIQSTDYEFYLTFIRSTL